MSRPPTSALQVALQGVESWPVAAAVGCLPPRMPTGAERPTGPGPVVAARGVGAVVAARGAGTDEALPWASVTKLLTALATWVAVEEGTVAFNDPAGPPGSTVAHLLSHASGLDADSDVARWPPATRRGYSNRGIALVAEAVAAASAVPFEVYLREAVLAPLGMTATTLAGSPASGAAGPLTDLLRLAEELRSPTLVDPSTVRVATTTTFPRLDGVLPGFGLQRPNDWGLGPEVRGSKDPHWTGTRNSPATFGHFGQSGSLLWVDPAADTALVALATEPFGPWAAAAWPALADAVLDAGAARPA